MTANACHLHGVASVGDAEIITYFENMGYHVDWDHNSRRARAWYELWDDDGLVAQIDMGIPLATIKVDLLAWAHGEKSTSKEDYEIVLPRGKKADWLFAAVRTEAAK